MAVTRRDFLRTAGGGTVAGVVACTVTEPCPAAEPARVSDDWMGVLVDIPRCIGCRKCEFACQEAAGFKVPPMESFEDKSVMAQSRRPQPGAYTVVNRYAPAPNGNGPTYVKANCLHCNDPACLSACLVGAFRKEANGAVTYDASKCMGCRYCMVACPFQIPTYDYDNALTPQVRKCTLCHDKIKAGGAPACVTICPTECLTYGKRSDLLALAHERIHRNPGQYIDHVYGEHEVGGTSWLYVSGVPFEELGFLALGSTAPPRLTEAIQHGVFKFFVPPLALYGLLGLVMWLGKQREQPESADADMDRDAASTARPVRRRRRTSREGALT